MLRGDFLCRFMKDLLDSAKILPKTSERFRKRLVCRVPNSVLLQRQGCIEQRTSSCQSVNRFVGCRYVWFNDGSHLLIEARQRVLPRGRERKIHARTQL